jgi:DNA repair/transcription protein MET18/MMS19
MIGLNFLFIECKHHLSEPELRLIHPTSKILVAMCNASEGSCKAVAPKVLGVIQDQLTQKTVGEEKKRLLSITQLILSSSRQYSHGKSFFLKIFLFDLSVVSVLL